MQLAAHAWRSWLVVVHSAWLAITPSFLALTAEAVAAYTTLVVGLTGLLLSIWLASTVERRQS